MRGPSLLKKFLKDAGQRPVDLSAAANIDEALISRWLSGKRRPNIDSALRLDKATKGAVPATAWAKARRSRAA